MVRCPSRRVASPGFDPRDQHNCLSIDDALLCSPVVRASLLLMLGIFLFIQLLKQLAVTGSASLHKSARRAPCSCMGSCVVFPIDAEPAPPVCSTALHAAGYYIALPGLDLTSSAPCRLHVLDRSTRRLDLTSRMLPVKLFLLFCGSRSPRL